MERSALARSWSRRACGAQRRTRLRYREPGPTDRSRPPFPTPTACCCRRASPAGSSPRLIRRWATPATPGTCSPMVVPPLQPTTTVGSTCPTARPCFREPAVCPRCASIPGARSPMPTGSWVTPPSTARVAPPHGVPGCRVRSSTGTATPLRPPRSDPWPEGSTRPTPPVSPKRGCSPPWDCSSMKQRRWTPYTRSSISPRIRPTVGSTATRRRRIRTWAPGPSKLR